MDSLYSLLWWRPYKKEEEKDIKFSFSVETKNYTFQITVIKKDPNLADNKEHALNELAHNRRKEIPRIVIDEDARKDVDQFIKDILKDASAKSAKETS